MRVTRAEPGTIGRHASEAWRVLVCVGLCLLGSCRGTSPDRAPAPSTVGPAAATVATASPVGVTAPEPPASEPAAGEVDVPPPTPWPPEPPSGVESDFCIETVHALDEETCYVLPDAPTTELLLYLHGIVPPAKRSEQKTNFETVVANAARRAGVAALMPRGRRGLAPKGRESWWGWPTSAAAYTKLAKELVEGFDAKRAKLEVLTGTRFERLYLAGSSSGAYFVAALALRGDLIADGYGAMSGGAASAHAKPAELAPKPFYIGYGLHDTVGPHAKALAEQLRRAGWPVKIAAHPLNHGAKEIYLDEAFAFWREAAR